MNKTIVINGVVSKPFNFGIARIMDDFRYNYAKEPGELALGFCGLVTMFDGTELDEAALTALADADLNMIRNKCRVVCNMFYSLDNDVKN